MGRRPRKPFAEAISEEMVKRFDEISMAEIRKHNNALIKYQLDLKYLTDSFREVFEEQNNIKNKIIQSQKDIQETFSEKIRMLEREFEDHRLYIHDSRGFIENKLRECDRKMEESISNEYFENFTQKLNENFHSISKNIEDVKKSFNVKLHDMTTEMFYELEDLEKTQSGRAGNMDEILKELNEKVEIYKVDAKGIVRDFNVFKKDVFVMEKKIENIYTLIGRLKEKFLEVSR